MGIPMNSVCIPCRIERILHTIRQLGDEQQAMAFLKQWMEMVSRYPEQMDSTRCGYHTDRLMADFYGVEPASLMAREKHQSNEFVKARFDTILSRMESAPDPVYAGLQYAILGNYLDFSALLGRVSFGELDGMLDKALSYPLDKQTVDSFRKDLEAGKNLLILADNAGEIGFDRALAKVLEKQYPHLSITFCVRGAPISNDATREDAQAVGVEFPIIDSGVAVGGTALELCSPQTREAVEKADVILSKGMGNLETMYGTGYNIYFAFMAKCQRVAQVFDVPLMQVMFVKEGQAQ